MEFGAAGPVPASAGALGDLPVGVAQGEAGGARGAGRGRPTRRLTRTGGPGTGPRPRPGRTRRSRRSWSTRRAGRRPAAGWPRPPRSWSARCADARSGAPRPSARWPRRRPACRPARSTRPAAAGHGGRPGRWTSCSAQADLLRGQIAFASGGAATLRPLLLGGPTARAARSRPRPPRPIWAPGPRRSSADLARATFCCLRSARAARAAPAPRAHPRRARSICCSMAWPSLVTDGRAAAAPAAHGRQRRPYAGDEIPVDERPALRLAGHGRHGDRCGTRSAGMRSRPGSCGPAARPACSPCC